MTSKAHVDFDVIRSGVRIALTRAFGSECHVLRWQEPSITAMTEGSAVEPDDAWLRLPEDDARALYEALGDYFGHGGHDTRALRKDYDAERFRVDLLIRHLTEVGPRA